MTFSRYTIVTAIYLLTSAISLAQTLDYINADANVIAMNGDNWRTLRSSLASLQENNASISILQIGDSHIQAD